MNYHRYNYPAIMKSLIEIHINENDILLNMRCLIKRINLGTFEKQIHHKEKKVNEQYDWHLKH